MTKQKNVSINRALHNRHIVQYIPQQLDNEGDLQYIWLQIYCMHGMYRSLESVVALLRERDVSPDDTALYETIKAASIEFDWVNRAQQYDINYWAKTVNDLADVYAQKDSEWLTKCEDTKAVIKGTIKTALDIQTANSIILESVKHGVKEYQSNMLAIFKLQKALKGVSDTTLNALEILTKAWQIREHTETIQMAESWQQQALEALRK